MRTYAEYADDLLVIDHHGSQPRHIIISHPDRDHLSRLDPDKIATIVKLTPNTAIGQLERARTFILLEGDEEQLYFTTGIDVAAASRARLVTPPGSRLSRLTQLCLAAEAHRLMVWPTIMDMRLEYAEARNAHSLVPGCLD